MKIVMIIGCEKNESEFIWDGELNAGGRRESNALICALLNVECLLL